MARLKGHTFINIYICMYKYTCTNTASRYTCMYIYICNINMYIYICISLHIQQKNTPISPLRHSGHSSHPLHKTEFLFTLYFCCSQPPHTLKLCPQPHSDFLLGLLKTNLNVVSDFATWFSSLRDFDHISLTSEISGASWCQLPVRSKIILQNVWYDITWCQKKMMKLFLVSLDFACAVWSNLSNLWSNLSNSVWNPRY